MEPDIIRMYSSSPPPLDNGAEEEEEEFGDFGGFSGAGSASVGFDFTSDYSGSNEERKSSYNSDYSGNVDSIIAFTTVRYAHDKESITELPNSIKGLPDSSRENCECKSFDASFDEVSPVEVKRSGKLESSYPEIIRTDMTVPSQDQQIDSCNGEKQPCPEVLTNGFVAPDTANSQGVEDMDSISDSKGLKIISTHSTELSLDSIASTAEDFADFAKFSNKQTTQVEETGNKICKNSSEREVLNVQENNIINRVGGRESMKEATSDRICGHEGETSTEGERISISKINLVIVGDLKATEDCTALEHNIVSSIKTNVNSVGTRESTEAKGEGDTGNSREHIVSWTNDTAKTLNFNISRAHRLSSLPTVEEKVHVSETIKNGESSTGHTSCSGSSEDDFGDFGTVSNDSPVFADGTQASAHQEHFQITNDNTSKLNNECGDFTDRSDTNQQSTEIELPRPSAVSSTMLEEHLTFSSHSVTNTPSPAEMENGDDNEFGDFGSVAKRFPDSDDFSDFSSAGCNQAIEWDAFEAEQKESCTWAAFEEQPVVESHPERDTWPLHRTDITSGAEGSVIPSVCITSLHGTGSEQLHELSTSARVITIVCF